MLSQLREIVEKVSRVDVVYRALDVLVKETCRALSTECCTVYLANEHRERLELMATQGLILQGNEIHIAFNEGLVGLVKRQAEPLSLAKASEHPNFKFFPQIGEDLYQAFLGTPIIYRKQVLGVLVVQQKKSRLFNDIEESFLVTLSAQLAPFIAHAQSQGHWSLDSEPVVFSGVAASSGIAIGQFWVDQTQLNLSDVKPASTLDINHELDRLEVAIEQATHDFRRMRKRLDGDVHKQTLAIFDLFTHLLNDPVLQSDLKQQIGQGDSADWALAQVIERYIHRFSQMDDNYLKERANDIAELGQRLLYFLHNDQPDRIKIDQPVIVVANILTASLLASIPTKYLLAVISLEGAANSHAAILSRALGVPAIMGANLELDSVVDKFGIVDGYTGEIFIDPAASLLTEYQGLVVEESELFTMVNQFAHLPATMQSGETTEILLNAGLGNDCHLVATELVDGVGLYRTEIAFLLQQGFPSEDEQILQYRNLLETYQPKKVIMRTLDFGGDKALPYFPLEEENPFLGWRGIRFSLDHPDIFVIQVRAMLRASIGLEPLSLLLPMISGIQEFDKALGLIEQAYQDVITSTDYLQSQQAQLTPLAKPKIGIMVEVPSMIYLLPMIAPQLDFISVGTNDLTQYLLAVDRGNAKVSAIYESMHPAVLLALKQIIDICYYHQLPACVCGELAGDPSGALLLLGLGYTSLSMNAANVAKIKYLIRHCHLRTLESLASQAINTAYGSEIQQMMHDFFIQHDLAGFIRAGKR